MSIINKTYNKTAMAEVPYPGIDGFVVKVAFVDREELTKMVDKSTVLKFNKRSRVREDQTDNNKFIELYSKKAILGWSGLKVKHLPELYPADISALKPEDEVPYDEEEALDLLTTSVDFDRFITDVMNDLETFNKKVKDEEEKNLKSSSPKSS